MSCYLLDNEAVNKRIKEVAEGDSVKEANSVKGFLDNYYAMNGYFAFSATKKDMSNKDMIHDKLQTFLDEKLLDITTLMSTKKKQETSKADKILQLSKLNEEIGKSLVVILKRGTDFRKRIHPRTHQQ